MVLRSLILLAVVLLSVVSSSDHLVVAQANDSPTVMAEGKELASGATYIIPGHSETSSLALFTESVQTVSIYNKTGKDMTVSKVEISVGEGMESEEFTLLKGQLKRESLTEVNETITDGKNWAFKVRFYPVESGTRTGKVTVTYNTDKTYKLNLQGRARGETKFFEGGKTTLHKVLGATKTDEIISGAVAGPDGSVFFTGQATQIADKFSTDIFWAKVNADGSLAWAKLWYGKFMDRSPDSGQNAETGGTCNSLASDEEGNLYLCAATSPTRYNSNFATMVIKVDGKTGEPIWEQQWRPEWASSLIARHGTQPYALAVHKGKVFVTGECGSGEIMLLNLSAKDGSLQGQHSFDPTPKKNDRGYSIVAHDDDSVTIGGLADSRAILLRINGASSDTPKVVWSKTVDMGRGSGINCLASDTEGNVYASCDRRGATTFFSAIRVNADGSLAWGKTYKGSNGDRNNTHLVRVIGDTVYVGGRLGASGLFDTAFGDGLLLALNTTDGGEKWSAFYYTGTGPDESGEHRIKGVVLNDNKLTIVGQSYTGSRNGVRYSGYWYNGVTSLEDYKPDLSDFGLAEDALKAAPKGGLKPVAETRTIVDLVEKLEWQDANTKIGQSSDGDVSVWHIELK